jgi:hypothetical protein
MKVFTILEPLGLFIPANAWFSKLLDRDQRKARLSLIAISKGICYNARASRSIRRRFLIREAIQLWKTTLY